MDSKRGSDQGWQTAARLAARTAKAPQIETVIVVAVDDTPKLNWYQRGRIGRLIAAWAVPA